MRLVLIRHGQTEWNLQRRIQGWKDSNLTSDALVQLQQLSLPELCSPVLFSSDLGRALQSAQVLASRLNIDINADCRLRERKFGLLEGEVIDGNPDMAEHWHAYHNRYRQKFSGLFGAESEQQFEQRIMAFLAELNQGYVGQDIIIVSHGEWLRALINILHQVPSWYEGPGVESNAKPIVIDCDESLLAQLFHSEKSA